MDTSTEESAPKEIVTDTIQAKYTYTETEKQKLSSELCASLDNIEGIEAELASVKQEFKSRVEKAELERDTLRRRLRDGFEMRPTLCRIEFNSPVPNRKQYINESTDEVVREESMSAADYERPLFKEIFAPKEQTVEDPDGTGIDVQTLNTGDVDAGQTPIGEALDRAAASKSNDPVLIDNFDGPGWTPKGLRRAFEIEAKRGKWSAPEISVIMDQIKDMEDIETMKATLRPHVIAGDKEEE